MVFENLEKRVKKFGVAIGLVATAMMYSPSPAYAETVYYGKVKDAKSSAYVQWDTVKAASKYTKELDKLNTSDPQYNTTKDKRNKSVKDAIKKVGEDKKYDVVVEKDDPKIDNYKNINDDVKKKIEELEK